MPSESQAPFVRSSTGPTLAESAAKVLYASRAVWAVLTVRKSYSASLSLLGGLRNSSCRHPRSHLLEMGVNRYSYWPGYGFH